MKKGSRTKEVVFYILICTLFLGGCTKKNDADDFFSRKNLNHMGISYKFIGNILTININSDDIVNSASELQKQKIIDPKISEFRLHQLPISLSDSAIFIAACLFIPEIYSDNKAVNKIDVYAYVLSPDQFGDVKPNLAYSFSFDRTTFQKIKWNNFNCDMENIAQHLQVSPWLLSHLYEETDHTGKNELISLN